VELNCRRTAASVSNAEHVSLAANRAAFCNPSDRVYEHLKAV